MKRLRFYAEQNNLPEYIYLYEDYSLSAIQ